MNEVVEIPAGIVQSWQGRDPDFDFAAITGGFEGLAAAAPSGAAFPPGALMSHPRVGAATAVAPTAPLEREVTPSRSARAPRVARVQVSRAATARVVRRAGGPPPGAVQDPRLPDGWMTATYGKWRHHVYYSPQGDRFTSFERAQVASGTTSQTRPLAQTSGEVAPAPSAIVERTPSRTASQEARAAGQAPLQTARQLALARGRVGPSAHGRTAPRRDDLPRGICGRVEDGRVCRLKQFHDLCCVFE